MERMSIEASGDLKGQLRSLVRQLREGGQDVQGTAYRRFMETLDPFEVRRQKGSWPERDGPAMT